MAGEVRSVIVRLSASTSGYIAEMNRAGAATETAMNRASRATSVHTKALGALGAVAKGTGIAVAGGLALAVKESADFGEKMALVKTLAHANSREMRELSHAAKTMGLQYGYTATQVADGEAEMIKAGIDLKDILGGGLKGTLALAAAGQTDVATATTIAASAMTEFKLKGKDIPHLADLLAAGADKALGSVEDLGYGLEQSGTTAHQMGLSVEQTVGTLAAFAQAGLIGERGGTTFKQMLLQLAAPTDKAAKLMHHYGLSLYDANGQIKTMPELAGNMQQAFGDIDPAARNAALGVIFGSRAIQGANILMADGEKGIGRWIRKVNDQGFAAQQAGGKLDSLKGDLQKFRAAADNAFIDLGSGSQSPLRGFVQDATSEIEKLTKNGDLKRWGREIGHDLHAIISDAKPLAKDVGHALQVVGGGVKTVVEEFNKLPPGVQHALITGGVVALGAHKLGLDSLAKGVLKGGSRVLGGGVAGGLVGRAAPVPVFVTNPGFGGGPGVPGEGEIPKQAGKWGKFAALAGPWALPLGFTALMLHEGQNKMPKYAPANVDPGVARGGRYAEGFYDRRPHALATYAMGATGQVQNATQAIQALDTAFANLAKHKPELAIKAVGHVSDVTGVSVHDLYAQLPKTADALSTTSDKAAEAKGNVKGLSDSIKGVPSHASTLFNTPNLGAELSMVRQYRGLLDGLDGRVATTFIRTVTEHGISKLENAGRSPGLAGGGRVPGSSPHPKADNIDIRATAGEHMWSVREVQGAGGHQRVERLRYLARSGQLRGYADGGPITIRPTMPTSTPVASLSAGRIQVADIDYERLAHALAAARPLYGDVHLQPHNYDQFTRQMLQDRRAAALDGTRGATR